MFKQTLFYKVTPKNLKDYEENTFFFTKPKLVAYYDYNHGNITKAKRMTYLKLPDYHTYPIDLNLCFETYIPREPTFFSVTIEISLMHFISDSSNFDERTKVITRRGTLVDLMELAYKKYGDNKRIRVSRFNQNLYMVKECDDSTEELKPVHTHHRRLEKMLFADSPEIVPKGDEPCDENIMLVGVHRSVFGLYDIIYSGEIQGIMEEVLITDFDDMDEISDRRFVFTKQMWENFKNKDSKFLKFWLQSYLANVRDIFIGYKTSNGLINRPLEHFSAKDLPKNQHWKPSVCTGFLYNFLQNVEKLMSAVNCLNTVYVFEFHYKTRSFSYEIYRGKTEKSFIPEKYHQFLRQY